MQLTFYFRLYVRIAITLLLIVFMVWCANFLQEREFIFPELAALAVGQLVLVKRVWCIDKWRTLILLPSAALLGTVLHLYSPCGFVCNILFGFMGVALLLIVLRSSLYPAISACLLPLVIGEVSWLYPLIVLFLTVVLVCLQWCLEKTHFRTLLPFRPVDRTFKERMVRVLPILVIVVAVAFASELFASRFIILPPLVVLFVEFARPEASIRKVPIRLLIFIAIATLLGNFGKFVLEPILQMSQTLATGIVLLLLFAVFLQQRRYFAPAAAIAILPQLLHQENWFAFPLEVTLSAVFFVGVALLFFRVKGARYSKEATAS